MDIVLDSTRITLRTEESAVLNSVKPSQSIRNSRNNESIKAEQENRKPLLRSGSKSTSPSHRSDTQNDQLNKSNKVKKKRDSSPYDKPQEWAGSFGALLLTLSMQICLPLMQIACMNDHCGFSNFRIPQLSEWKLFINPNAFVLYAGYLVFIAIMSVLPIGKIVASQQSKGDTLQYRINGNVNFVTMNIMNFERF